MRWRCAQKVAHADIKHCYYKVANNKKDMSLRRVLLRPDGTDGSDIWREACFKTVSVGPKETRTILDRSFYMDDIMIGSNDKDNPVKKMITEVDQARLKLVSTKC